MAQVAQVALTRCDALAALCALVDKSGRVVLREEGEMFAEDVAALARFAAGA